MYKIRHSLMSAFLYTYLYKNAILDNKYKQIGEDPMDRDLYN